MLHRGLLFFDNRNTYHPKKSSPAAPQVIRFRIRLPAGSAFWRPRCCKPLCPRGAAHCRAQWPESRTNRNPMP